VLTQVYERYLRLLGIHNVPSGLEGLREIVRRHLGRAPFENVSKLLLFAREGAGRAFTLEEFLDGMERHDLGGTCYTCNPHLAGLLRHLGYEADLRGADMTAADVHTCVRVRIDGVPYHVDCGYGGPFREPLRLDRLPHEFQEGGMRYVLDRDTRPAAYGMGVFAGSQPVHNYIVHDPPRPADFFTPVVLKSFAPGQTFMKHLRIVKIFEEHSVELFDRNLAIHRGGRTSQTELKNLREWKDAVADELAMPRCPVEAVLDLLPALAAGLC